MPHTAIEDVGASVEVQPGAVVSKVVHRDDRLDVTVLAFDAGEGLSGHAASRDAIVEVVRGRLRFTADDATYVAGPGFWLSMASGTPHALSAEEPTVMVLTLLRS